MMPSLTVSMSSGSCRLCSRFPTSKGDSIVFGLVSVASILDGHCSALTFILILLIVI